ncbi:glutamate--tRNA ligase [Robiginitalea sp. IMCC43444]|uniref:glutamate--tRNA ligase n=1 Tax=Robiginitalea sp. IMCC43444 TaxID=3459121 RepID=UPI0040427319
MEKRTRVRFAPSPTGPLHIGGLRTALFNYLFAKGRGGDFILRIEDTDQNRYVPGAEEYIVESLEWLGIPFDEGPGTQSEYGPYRQSERLDLYADFAEKLIASGWAYYAFDRPESLDKHRAAHEAKGKTFIYNWHNREKLDNSIRFSAETVAKRIADGEPYVIRFKCPVNETIELHDLIRGQIRIDSNTLDDKVLFKSDGMPTYHLANIVDDHLMQISHVIRGEEWLPSLALHKLLYQAFGWESPQFAHLPLIMKPVGKGKLSKRDGEKLGFPVFPLRWKDSLGYREEGYFPETVLNFLALLGWNPGTEQELFTKEELINAFDLQRVNKSGARFDPEKNNWYNHQYLQKKSVAELLPAFKKLLETHRVDTALFADAFLAKVVAMVRERASFVKDLWQLSHYFFTAPKRYDEKAVRKQWKPETADRMQGVKQVLASVEDFNSESIESEIKEHISSSGLSFGQVMAPLRLAVVGALQGPHLFDIIELIGKEQTLQRIDSAIEQLNS